MPFNDSKPFWKKKVQSFHEGQGDRGFSGTHSNKRFSCSLLPSSLFPDNLIWSSCSQVRGTFTFIATCRLHDFPQHFLAGVRLDRKLWFALSVTLETKLNGGRLRRSCSCRRRRRRYLVEIAARARRRAVRSETPRYDLERTRRRLMTPAAPGAFHLRGTAHRRRWKSIRLTER
jgi:hypothetical protein